jgi:hypothetical protein
MALVMMMCCGLLLQPKPVHAAQEVVYFIGCTTIYTPDCGPGQNLVGTDREAMCQHPTFNGWTTGDHLRITSVYAPTGPDYPFNTPYGGCYITTEGIGSHLQGFVVNWGEVSTAPLALSPPAGSCPMAADPSEGNPIYPLRGVKREVVDTGLAIGRTTLQFSYDTSSKIPQQPASLAGFSGMERNGVLGSTLWFSNLHRRVSVGTQSDSSSSLPVPTVIDRGNGTAKTMTSTQTVLLKPEPDNADRLIPLAGGGYLYADSKSNVQETYTGTGQLTAMAWPDGTRVD